MVAVKFACPGGQCRPGCDDKLAMLQLKAGSAGQGVLVISWRHKSGPLEADRSGRRC